MSVRQSLQFLGAVKSAVLYQSGDQLGQLVNNMLNNRLKKVI